MAQRRTFMVEYDRNRKFTINIIRLNWKPPIIRVIPLISNMLMVQLHNAKQYKVKKEQWIGFSKKMFKRCNNYHKQGAMA